MPASVAELESQWRAQFDAMKAAIATLKLPRDRSDDTATQAYGHDLIFDDSDDLTAGSESDDIWDLLDGDANGDDFSSESADADADAGLAGKSSHRSWLETRCEAVARRTGGFDAAALRAQIMEVLRSSSSGT